MYNFDNQSDDSRVNVSNEHRKPKANHPWRAWNPGQFKRQSAPTPHRELHEITKPNRAR